MMISDLIDKGREKRDTHDYIYVCIRGERERECEREKGRKREREKENRRDNREYRERVSYGLSRLLSENSIFF